METLKEITDRLIARSKIQSKRRASRAGMTTARNCINQQRVSKLIHSMQKVRKMFGLNHKDHSRMRFRTFYPEDFQQEAFIEANRFTRELSGNLILFGSPGVGKTHLACAILDNQITRLIDTKKWILWPPPPNLFVDCMEFKDCLYAQFDNKVSGFAETERMIQSMIEAPLLILDDFAGEAKTSPNLRDRITRIMKSRLDRGFSTVITTNVTAEEIRDRYHKRVLDRLIHPATIIKINGPSQRGKHNEN